MNRRMLTLTLLVVCGYALFTSSQLLAQSQEAGQKLEHLAKQLKLTPQQKLQLAPILAAEGPKLQAVKSNTSLSGMEKVQQIKAIHDETDPQVQRILSPQQYEKWQEIRQKELKKAIEKKKQ